MLKIISRNVDGVRVEHNYKNEKPHNDYRGTRT